MPTYQYKCRDCEHKFEVFQSMTEDPIDTCPACGGKAERLISGGAGFIFKGSGFYQTDYRSKDYREKASKEKSDSTVSAADKSSSKDSASASTPAKDSSKKKE